MCSYYYDDCCNKFSWSFLFFSRWKELKIYARVEAKVFCSFFSFSKVWYNIMMINTTFFFLEWFSGEFKGLVIIFMQRYVKILLKIATRKKYRSPETNQKCYYLTILSASRLTTIKSIFTTINLWSSSTRAMRKEKKVFFTTPRSAQKKEKWNLS